MWQIRATVFKILPRKCQVPSSFQLRFSSSTSSLVSDAELQKELPSSAQVVICGGGVIGASVAYHLPKVGIKDVVLLEQGRLSCGTTWHAAGLLGSIRGTRPYTKVSRYSNQLYSSLEEETGLGTGFKQTGALILAHGKDRMKVLRRTQAIGRSCGVESEIIAPKEVEKICPILRTNDIVGALYVPNDISSVSPSDVCHSLAKGATQQGVQLFEGVCVEGVEVKNGRVAGVNTDHGHIDCEIFVNCAGQWARDLGYQSDPVVNIPLHSTHHYYIVTKPFKEVDLQMPTVRDQDAHMYIREWSGGILAGCFETNGKPCFQDGVPKNFEFQLLPEDWDHCQPLLDGILHRVPAMENAEIRQMINGPESFTPDMHAILGEAPEIQNYFVAAGMNSGGIASAGGFGKALAEWIVAGEPPFDMWKFDIARFSSHQANRVYLNDRSRESLCMHYFIPWPHWEWTTCRGIKKTPFHSRNESAGASFGCVYGWERPNWFATSEGESHENEHTFGIPNWFENVKEEHLACRTNVALFDMSPFAKLEIKGPNAEVAMQMLCSNNVAVSPGKVVYTAMLNKQGGFQTDCTVTRLSQNKYLAICPSAQANHVAAWMDRHLPPSVGLSDVSTQYCVLAVMGPRSRDLLQKTTRTPLDNGSFPFATSQVIDVGYATGVRAIRITYMGELGWELHIPTEYALHVYDHLMSVGAEFDLRLAGAYAMDSLRIEKAFRHWGHELDTETTPWEAGLGFAVDMKKDNFIGRDALVKQQEEGVRQQLGIFAVDIPKECDSLPWGNETIYRNGEYTGYVTSAAYGHYVDKVVCLGYVSNGDKAVSASYLKNGQYEIEIDGQLWPAEISLKSLYDPASLRVKF